MSQIAEQAGIGRATLYKYFPDVESILAARHQRHVAAHLDHLTRLRDQSGTPAEHLETVLTAYAFISYRRGRHAAAELSALVHRPEHIAPAQQQLTTLIRDLLAEAAAAGEARDDTAPEELAAYCLHALSAAADLPSEAAVHRLVGLTVDGLRARN